MAKETIFEIPVKAVNFTKSFLTFDFQVPAATLAAGNANWVFFYCLPHFRTVQLYTRCGVWYVSSTKVTVNPNTELQDFLTFGNA